MDTVISCIESELLCSLRVSLKFTPTCIREEREIEATIFLQIKRLEATTKKQLQLKRV